VRCVAIEWGPAAVWASAVATVLAVLVALLSSLGAFGRFRAPRLRVTFEPIAPWCRTVAQAPDKEILWVRIGVENAGSTTARGCLGRLTGLRSDDVTRTDIDPIQLRWAGVPRSMSFDPVDLRQGQREFLNVLFRRTASSGWTIDTFVADDFSPGFSTELDANQKHVVNVTLFADNARTITRSLEIDDTLRSPQRRCFPEGSASIPAPNC
jgi:hypothetical protein